MGLNLRKLFSNKKDEELIVIHSQAQQSVWQANRGYKKGGISSELAQTASESAVVATVTAAVIKTRVENGDENSHRRLQDIGVNVSQKRIDRGWGLWLSRRRV